MPTHCDTGAGVRVAEVQAPVVGVLECTVTVVVDGAPRERVLYGAADDLGVTTARERDPRALPRLPPAIELVLTTIEMDNKWRHDEGERSSARAHTSHAYRTPPNTLEECPVH